MKKSEMVCLKCIKSIPWETNEAFVACRENATALHEGWAMENDAWCARGHWAEWSERHQCWLSYYWGEWDKE